MSDSSTVKQMSRLKLFVVMYPPAHVLKVIPLTNWNLRKIGKALITKGGLFRFYGVVILGDQFEFGIRKELWSTNLVF